MLKAGAGDVVSLCLVQILADPFADVFDTTACHKRGDTTQTMHEQPLIFW